MTREQVLAASFLKALTYRVVGHPVCVWHGASSMKAFTRLREMLDA